MARWDYAGSPRNTECVKFAGMEDLTLAMSAPRSERADAARNRQHLLDTARELMHEIGAEKVTMDGLAARSGLGKGTVFRRFGSRAGIFQALLDDAERSLQLAVMGGDPRWAPAHRHTKDSSPTDTHASNSSWTTTRSHAPPSTEDSPCPPDHTTPCP